jgi:hypothetical protein
MHGVIYGGTHLRFTLVLRYRIWKMLEHGMAGSESRVKDECNEEL